jgi:hypothetical protein
MRGEPSSADEEEEDGVSERGPNISSGILGELRNEDSEFSDAADVEDVSE